MAHFYRGRDITLAYDESPSSTASAATAASDSLQTQTALAARQARSVDSLCPSPRHPRDGWNARLEARHYLIEQPPMHFLQIPKSSRPCLYPGFQNPVISTPCEWRRAAQFYHTTAGPQAIPGLKIAAPLCAGRDHITERDLPSCQDFGTPTALNTHAHGQLPQRGTANVATSAQAAVLATVQGPAVAGVKFNIDRDSELRQRTHYDPTDVCGLCDRPAPEIVQSGLPGGQQGGTFEAATPAVFWNVTRQRNLVGQVRIPVPGTDRVLPSCCGV